MRRPLVSVVLLYAGGVVLGRVWAAPLPWLFLATALALLTSLLHRCRPRRWLALALVLAGWTHCVSRTIVLSPYDPRQVLGETAEYVTIQGELAYTPEVRGVAESDRKPRTLAVLEVNSCTVKGAMRACRVGSWSPRRGSWARIISGAGA